jgi:hypothetical protein
MYPKSSENQSQLSGLTFGWLRRLVQLVGIELPGHFENTQVADSP